MAAGAFIAAAHEQKNSAQMGCFFTASAMPTTKKSAMIASLCAPPINVSKTKRVHRREHERLAGVAVQAPGQHHDAVADHRHGESLEQAKPTTVQSSWCCEIQSILPSRKRKNGRRARVY